MNIKNNDLIIIFIALFIAYLIFINIEGFINVNPETNFNVINSMLSPIQTNINNLISMINNANNTLNTLNYSNITSPENKAIISSQIININKMPSILTTINNNFMSLVNEINIDINLNLIFDLFQRNFPSSFYIADKMNGYNLTNLITGIHDGVINKIPSNLINRSDIKLPSISGDTSVNITWSVNSLKPTHTLIGITKYNGNNRGKIFTTTQNNALYGHWSNKEGIASINSTYITQNNTNNKFIVNSSDWVVTCVRATNLDPPSNTNRINDVIINNGASGNGTKIANTNTNNTLSINANDASDFSFSTVCIIDSYLSDDDMILLSKIFSALLLNPLLFNYVEFIIATINNQNNLNASQNKASFNQVLINSQIAYTNKLQSTIATINNSSISLDDKLNLDVNLRSLFDLFQRNVPSGFYVADKMTGYNLTNLITGINDGVINKIPLFVNNRSITTMPFISGDTLTTIIWPVNSLKSTHTLIGITKYTGNNKGRIFNTTQTNAFYGHYSGKEGVANFNSTWITQNNSSSKFVINANDWVVTCVRATNLEPPSNTNRINDVIINNGASGNGNKVANTNTNNTLSINSNETSDFSFSTVCIIDSYLSDDDMILLSKIFNSTLQNPLLFNYIEFTINEVYKQINSSASLNKASINQELFSSQLTLTNKIQSVIPSLNNNLISLSDKLNLDNNLKLFYDLFKKNIPSALYIADRINNNVLINLITGLNDGIINKIPIKINRSSTNLPSISGDTTTNIVWFDGSIKPTHTLFCITKYNGNNKGRILGNKQSTSLYGHWNGNSGVAYINNTWITQYGSNSVFVTNINDWVVTCVRTTNLDVPLNTTRINDVIINNGPSGNGTKPTIINTNNTLTLNNSESSDFSFSTVCIIDSFLSDDDIISFSNVFNSLVKYPQLINYIEFVIIEILKQVNSSSNFSS